MRSAVMVWPVPLRFTMRSVQTVPWPRVARWQTHNGQLDSRGMWGRTNFLGDPSQVQLMRCVVSKLGQ
jgi:hypothetical protein